jgi:hypothetical protein
MVESRGISIHAVLLALPSLDPKNVLDAANSLPQTRKNANDRLRRSDGGDPQAVAAGS